MTRKRLSSWFFFAALLLAAYSVGGKGCDWNLPPIVVPPVVVEPPVVVPVKPTAVTFVYEKDLHVVPPPVLAAFNKLNRQGIIANPFEDDTQDGTGDVPDQYKVPLAAALAAGFPDKPVLVVTAGAKVLRVVKDPKTEAEVMEAVKL